MARSNLSRSILFLLLIFILLFRVDDIGRKFYPFPYRETITHYAEANGIDPFFLAALIKTESSFDPKAKSPAGAIGLLQIMPETGYWIAEQMKIPDFNPGKLYHPETSIRMGAWYLANLKQEFKGDQALVLAAYNAGRGNVKRWLEHQHWTGETKTIDQIPFPETRNYIRKVMFNYKVYKFLYNKA
ncbi:MAG: lytic transglycosylase domain-containing protein [Desulfotomaculum sp.]|nr:lytic transglycosylase domain-containing protein [Desulfotomaculum sp.]